MQNSEQQMEDLLNQIAQLKAENEALHQEKNSYKQQWERAAAVLNSYNGAIWYIDTNYRLLEYNTAFQVDILQYYGRFPQKGDFIFDKNANEDPNAHFWIEHYDNVLKGKNDVFSFPMESLDRESHYECHLFPAKDAVGNIIGVYGFKQEVTNFKILKKNMHNLRQIYSKK